MDDIKFRVGDRVKVEYEAVVTCPDFYPDRVVLDRKDGRSSVRVPKEYVTVIEPEYQAGELYQSSIGHVYEYKGGTGDNAWTLAKGKRPSGEYYIGNTYPFRMPTRPLVRLVPEK